MSEQGTPEWFAEKCGKVTASKIADVMATTKTGPGAARKNYMGQLLTERLTGVIVETFTNSAMQWGTDTEPRARAMYELQTGYEVEQIGFVPHPIISGTGASPDGLVSYNGLLEIKCPQTITHVETLSGAKIDRKYLLQMHWQMICAEREWCDFVSFDPRLPAAMQLHIQRVERDAELSEEITAAVTQFLTELNELETQLRDRYLRDAA